MNEVETQKNEGSIKYLVGISLVAALGGMLFGYDTGVISGAIGFLQEAYNLTPRMVGWVASCALVGCMVGVAFAGMLADYIGRKKVLVLAAILFFVSALGTALPQTLMQFIVFRFIGGLGVGIASMTSPMYIAEITPARIRGRMVSLNQFAIITGMLAVYFANMFIEAQGDDAWDLARGWRWMFGSEALPAALLFVLALFVPESPRWLAKQGLRDKALKILSRVGGREHAQREMVEIEDAMQHEGASIRELFKPGMTIVLIIGVSLAILQQVTGINVFLYFGPEIFKQLGSDMDAALLQQVVIGTANLVFTIIAIWTVDRLGRKPLMLIGAAGMGICLFAQGACAIMGITAKWMLILVIGYIACFALSLGPVVWVYLSEIFPNKIRGRAMSISTLFLWLSCWAVSQSFPMMDKNEYLIEKFNHGFPFFVYGAFCIVTFIFVWLVVPETKGKSLEEIENMWVKGDK